MAKARILMIGTGAIGSLYGGMLQRAGAAVSVICRSDYDVVAARGIEVDSVWGKFRFRPEQVYRRAAEVDTPPDFVIVALKVLPAIAVPELVREAMGQQTSLVLLQNGVEIEAPVAAAFPEHEIISGLAFVCSHRLAPGRVRHLDYGRVTFGRYPGGDSPRVLQLQQLLSSVGVPCQVTEDIVSARWVKLVWNAPFNPMSVLGGGVTTAAILADPHSARLAATIMAEVTEIAAGVGAAMPATVIADMLRYTEQMQPYKTSMLLDYEAGRPMEVEAILGNAVAAADRVGVAAPALRALYALLRLVDAVRQG